MTKKIVLPSGGWVAVSKPALFRDATNTKLTCREQVKAAALWRLGSCRCAIFAKGELAKLVDRSRQMVDAAIKELKAYGVLDAVSNSRRLVLHPHYADTSTGSQCAECRAWKKQLDSYRAPTT